MGEVTAISAGNQEMEIREKFSAELKKQLTTKRLLFGFGSVVGLVVILPLAILAVKAGLALVAVGALGLGGLVAWKKIPRWILSVENRERERVMAEQNRHIAALKAEARKNPIEQAENEYLRRSKQYEAFKQAMEMIGGKVSAFKSKLDRTKKEKPQYDLSEETQAYEKMRLFYVNRVERMKIAYVKLGAFKEKIEQARTKWEFQLDANMAIRAMNATDQEARINEILTEVSFDSVQQEFDSVFAKLDVDAAELNSSRALEFGDGATIDVSAIHIDQPELQLVGNER